MIFLTTIFFIFELFVAVSVCIWIAKIDSRVNSLCEKIQINRHNLKFKLRAVYDSVQDLKRGFEHQRQILLRKRKEFIRNVIKALMMGVLFMIIKKSKHKKKFLFLQLLLVFYDTYNAEFAV